MTERVTLGRLQVAANLQRFIEDEVLPGTGIEAAAFWQGLDALVHDLAPKNRELLAERDRMQLELDSWHKANPGPIRDMAAYRAFLESIGYLLPVPGEVKIETANVDSEIATQAGPQLVVPIMNARYALNAANARWGSLYDALYGTDAISEEGGAQIIVGTPGRIQQHLSKGTLKLDGLNTLVLDEADRMLDMGFYDSIAEIIEQTPARRQTLLFSATYPTGIKQLSAKFMRDPQQVKVEALHDDSQIEQRFYEIAPEERMDAVVKLLNCYRPQSCVAFCFTKQQCQEVVDHLTAKGISAAALNGDLEQRDRDQVLAMFANRSLSVLVATDVAARGLDIDALDMVINVELARDSEIHIHRVGRTGRAGEKGLAMSLVAPAEGHRAQAIETLQRAPLNWHPLSSLKAKGGAPLQPPMITLCIGAGRKDKLRPGDILGALTGEGGIPGAQVGKIAIFDFQAYVAVERVVAMQALKRLSEGKIKGRTLRIRTL